MQGLLGGLIRETAFWGWAGLCPMLHGLGVLGHGCSWGCPSSQHPHGKAWSLPGHWIWLFFIMGERYGESRGALLQIPAPSLVLVQACAPTFMPAGKKAANPASP